MGRLTLNILLSFAQFEREVIGERIRDKSGTSRKKGMWMGGVPPLGYEIDDRRLGWSSVKMALLRRTASPRPAPRVPSLVS
jgi:DNA invertase Pin-like site-specific DNA recombinase